MQHIIIQAGGKGTRLEGLTKNKPKCLVPYDNAPLIFHLFRKFPQAKFTIIADYKIEILQKYLAIFAKNYNYKILNAKGEGTISGLGEAIRDFDENEPFMVIWCDLILSHKFELPSEFLSDFDGVCSLQNDLQNAVKSGANSTFQSVNSNKTNDENLALQSKNSSENSRRFAPPPPPHYKATHKVA